MKMKQSHVSLVLLYEILASVCFIVGYIEEKKMNFVHIIVRLRFCTILLASCRKQNTFRGACARTE